MQPHLTCTFATNSPHPETTSMDALKNPALVFKISNIAVGGLLLAGAVGKFAHVGAKGYVCASQSLRRCLCRPLYLPFVLCKRQSASIMTVRSSQWIYRVSSSASMLSSLGPWSSVSRFTPRRQSMCQHYIATQAFCLVLSAEVSVSSLCSACKACSNGLTCPSSAVYILAGVLLLV